jgi:hypothetical protein
LGVWSDWIFERCKFIFKGMATSLQKCMPNKSNFALT